MTPLEPDRDQIEIFVDALFRYASKDGFVSSRAFFDGDDDRPFRIQGIPLSGGLGFLIDAAEDDARRAAQCPKPVVFCPPVAIFANKDRATERDLAQGIALSVELDVQPRAAVDKLVAILGPPTVLVRSGGTWADPGTGEKQDKLHAYWRLKSPAQGGDLERLKRARKLAAAVVGGDPTNVPAVHPIRWPGSWHRKAEPRLCEIVEASPDCEINLEDAIAALTPMAPDIATRTTRLNGQSTSHIDDPPREWHENIKGITDGEGMHPSLVSFAMKLLKSGMHDAAAVNLLRGMLESSNAPRNERWQKRYHEIVPAVSSAREKLGTPEAEADAEPAPLSWLDMSKWDDGPPPERQWAIFNRAPLNQAGLFSGEGGAGKSIIELMKNVAHVAGKDWLGSMPEPGPAFYIGAEDDADEIHRRLAAIANHYGVTFRQLIQGGLHVLPLLGQDATLCAATGKTGKVEVTGLYRRLYEAAGDIKPKNISIDTLSRAFAGDEINRVQVYGFAMHMQALAKVATGSVTVLSHPSLSGLASGSGLSGSTAWHNAFRFRHYLKGVKAAGDDDEPDTDLRELEFKKNQYGPLGETIVLRYQRGLFLPVVGNTSLEKLAAEQRADDLFLTLLARFNGQGRNVSDKPNANAYGPAAFAKEAQAKAQAIRKRDLEASMQRLFAAHKIRVEHYGRPARPLGRLVVAERNAPREAPRDAA
jgi:RecA-family ATPase